jgi:hypothetical protein
LFSTPAEGCKAISGAILFHETVYQVTINIIIIDADCGHALCCARVRAGDTKGVGVLCACKCVHTLLTSQREREIKRERERERITHD